MMFLSRLESSSPHSLSSHGKSNHIIQTTWGWENRKTFAIFLSVIHVNLSIYASSGKQLQEVMMNTQLSEHRDKASHRKWFE